MKRSYFAFVLLLAVLLFSSCLEQTPDVDPMVAPEIPPAELYVMPADALEDADTDTTAGATSGATYGNWIYAGVNLLVWNTAIVLQAGVPVAAFGHALNENAVYIGNATFEWSYQYVAPPALGGKTYDVVLTGQYINNSQEVEWIMTTSEVGSAASFVWYTGISSVDFSEATFTINHRPFNPQPYLQIDYARNADNTEASIRYTNVNPSNAGIGGYLEYRVDTGNDFDRAFDIQGGADNPSIFIEIQWNEAQKNGRVKSQNHFGDNNWHCWDSNHADIAC